MESDLKLAEATEKVTEFIENELGEIRNTEILKNHLEEYIDELVDGLDYKLWTREPLISLVEFSIVDRREFSILHLSPKYGALILNHGYSIFENKFQKKWDIFLEALHVGYLRSL